MSVLLRCQHLPPGSPAASPCHVGGQASALSGGLLPFPHLLLRLHVPPRGTPLDFRSPASAVSACHGSAIRCGHGRADLWVSSRSGSAALRWCDYLDSCRSAAPPGPATPLPTSQAHRQSGELVAPTRAAPEGCFRSASWGKRVRVGPRAVSGPGPLCGQPLGPCAGSCWAGPGGGGWAEAHWGWSGRVGCPAHMCLWRAVSVCTCVHARVICGSASDAERVESPGR